MSFQLLLNRAIFSITRNDRTKVRLTKAIGWSVLGSITARAFVLIGTIFIGRVLGKDIFGEFTLVQNIYFLLGSTLSTGISIAVSKLIAEERDCNLYRLKNYISLSLSVSTVFGLVLSIFLFILAPALSNIISVSPQIIFEFKLGIVFVLFSIINGSIFGVITGLERFKEYGLLLALHGFSFILFTLSGSIVGKVNGAVLGQSISEFISFLIIFFVMNCIVVRNYSYVSYWNFSIDEIKKLILVSFPSILSRIIILPAIWITNGLLVNQIGGIPALGIFNASDKFRQIILFLPITISGAILPILSNLNGNKEKRDYRKIFSITLLVNLFLSIILVGPLLIFSEWILSLYGNDFRTGALSLRVLVLSAIPAVVNSIYGQALISQGKFWIRILFDLLLGCLIVITSLSLIPKQLEVGLSISYLFSYSIVTILLVSWFKRHYVE